MIASQGSCASGLFTSTRKAPRTHAETDFAIPVRGPFTLRSAREFLQGFTPGSGTAASEGDTLSLAFRLDGTFEPVVVALTDAGSEIRGRAVGTRDAEAAAKQVARILSLDIDGADWPEVGKRDPVIGELQSRFPGARAVCFPSPYEAAAWGVLSQRCSMRQAAVWKSALASEHGDAVRLGTKTFAVFPAPATLVSLETCSTIPREKLARLRAVATAALAGRLDAEHLRALGERDALNELQAIHGIGAWTAQHVYMRGAGIADALPLVEPRVLRGMELTYGMSRTPSEIEYATIARKWRPYSMWVAILMVRALSTTPQWHSKR